MATITGNARNDIEQRLDGIIYQAQQARDLIVSETFTVDDPAPASYEDAVIHAFGQWVLDFLDPGGSDATDRVRRARKQFVDALAMYAPTAPSDEDVDGLYTAPVLDGDFEDLFAGEDPEDVTDDELGVLPVKLTAEE